MEYKWLKSIVIFLIIISLVIISVDIVKKENNQKANQESQDENKIYNIPLIGNISKIKNYNESLIEKVNLSSSLNVEIYSTNDSIQSIIDWYSQEKNRGNWTIKKSGLIGENPDKPEEITFGYVKFKQDKTGLYIFCMIPVNNTFNGKTLMGTALGNYSMVDSI